MADRTITLSLKSNVQGLISGVKTAQRAATDAGRDLDSFRKNNEQTWNAAGRTMTTFGTAALAGLGVAGKAAIDWESAWAGVQKTNDGTAEQMAELEDELRGLATTLPMTHAEIAGVAEAAGQLGIATEDVADFTKTMIDLGVSTNLTAEEAATSIAQMMNVMQTAPADVDNLGSALVALGNNGASTEKDILQMASRLAGTGQLIGASEADILALSNTMASLGISAEAGGGAMSRVMQDIYTSVEDGGDKLEQFADVAGMSADEFSTAFREDPVAAVDTFTQGLGRIGEEGGNVVGTLSELGIKSTEETRALLAMAGAGDMLSESLALGGEAWEENSALAEEAQQRYETAESRIAIAWNGIKDAAIDAGGVIVPVIEGAVEGAADLAQRFAELPDPAQDALVVIGGLAAATTAAGGATMLLLPKLQAGSEALRSIGPAGRAADKGIRGAAKGMGVLTAAWLAFEGVNWLNENFREGGVEASEMALRLSNLADNGGHASEALEGLGTTTKQTVSGIGSGIEDYSKLADSMDILDESAGSLNATQRDAEESWRAAEDALVEMVESGNIGQAVTQFSELAESARENGRSVEEVAERFPELTASIMKWAEASGLAISPAEALAWQVDGIEPKAVAAAGGIDAVSAAALGVEDPAAQLEASLGDVGLAADGTVESLGDFIDKMFESGLATMTAREASARFHESIDAADAAVQQIIESQGAMGATLNKSKTDFDLTTEAGRLANGAFQDITRSGFDAAAAMAENGASQEDVQGKLRNTYDSLLTAAEGFGLSEGKARDLTREVLGVPDGVTIDSWMSTEAEETANRLGQALDRQDGRVTRSSHVHTIIEQRRSSGNNQGAADLERGLYGQGALARGGRVPRRASGGRLPYTGLGTDMILGVNGAGLPVARVDDGEWVVRERSAQKYDSVLDRINRDHPSVQHLAGYAAGDRVNRSAIQSQQMVMAAAPAITPAPAAADTGRDMPAMMGAAVRGALMGAKLDLGFGHEKVLAKVVRVGESKISRL